VAADRIDRHRWTHVALPVSDIERSIAFYTRVSPLVVVARFQDEASGNKSAWLSNDGQADSPFVLVLAQFSAEDGKRYGLVGSEPIATLTPFAHLGMELPAKEDVDAVAALGEEMGCLRTAPRLLGAHVGYICALTDPDGNVVEFSFAQQVYALVRQKWQGDA
jgi:catechol 2,3-dioxygenase-like lactoylglutathione lyase family enzyme